MLATSTLDHRVHTGSAGEALITLDSAHLWANSRYHLQAEGAPRKKVLHFGVRTQVAASFGYVPRRRNGW